MLSIFCSIVCILVKVIWIHWLFSCSFLWCGSRNHGSYHGPECWERTMTKIPSAAKSFFVWERKSNLRRQPVHELPLERCRVGIKRHTKIDLGTTSVRALRLKFVFGLWGNQTQSEDEWKKWYCWWYTPGKLRLSWIFIAIHLLIIAYHFGASFVNRMEKRVHHELR